MHCNTNGGGRFLTKIFLLIFLWCLIVFTLLHIRSINLNLNLMSSVPHLNSRFLLQQKQKFDTLFTKHIESTTSSSSSSSSLLSLGLSQSSSLSSNIPALSLDGQYLDQDPFIDKSPSLSEDKLVEDIQKRMPNLPIIYWNKNKNKPSMGYNNTCARFPSMFDLEFNNLYWQTLRTTNGTFQLFGAYLDKRSTNRLGPTVRILGMIDRIEPTITTYCQFWFDGKKEPIISKSFEYKYIWYKKWGNYKQGIYQPYLIACIIPQLYRNKVPQSISLVENNCDNATNNLRVIYNQPAPTSHLLLNNSSTSKKEFAVCVKGLDFLHEDLSVRLIEWIELLNLLGADKIFFYQLQVHPNISKVLNYYEKLNKVHITPINLAGGQPNAPSFQHLYLTKKTNHKRQNELIPYNDCFYKHMYEYKYLVLLDIDEVIMPVDGMNWSDLMKKVLPKALKINKDERASYNVRNVYFLDDLIHNHGWFKEIPRYMHMLQHVYRTKNFTKPGQYVKCFHNTDKVLTLHNHFPLSCLGSSCTSYPIEVTDAQLHHYRADCVKTLKKSCEEFRKTSVMDTTIWKFKQPLIKNVTKTLQILGYFKNNNNNNNNNEPSSHLKR